MKPTFAGLGILLAAILLTACDRSAYTSSGLPDTLLAKSLVERVGGAQGVRITELAGGGGNDRRSHEVHAQYAVTMTSGTREQLLEGLRAEMQRLILASGETLYGSETVAATALRDFAFHYTDNHHKGVVRVYTADAAANEFRLILFCYEHPQ